jgi:hypothetical protein
MNYILMKKSDVAKAQCSVPIKYISVKHQRFSLPERFQHPPIRLLIKIEGRPLSSWSDIQPELVGLILCRLMPYTNHLRFRAVYRQWHLAAQEQHPLLKFRVVCCPRCGAAAALPVRQHAMVVARRLLFTSSWLR